MIHEPRLQLEDIQGLALPGLLKPHVALIHLRVIAPATATIDALKSMLDDGVFSSGSTALRDRRAHQSQRSTGGVLAGLAMSSYGMNALCADLARTVPSVAFRVGMIERGALLRDPEANDWHWRFGKLEPSFLIVLAGDCRAEVDALTCDLTKRLTLKDLSSESCFTAFGSSIRPANGPSREHFGFVDGISQPGIRGRVDGEHGPYLTPRRLPVTDPEHDLFGYPGQSLVWPGEFVLGYPASGPDPRIPGPVRQVPAWMHNGSFLVYRRLRQDVFGFRSWLRQKADELQTFPGFEGLSAPEREEKLAAKVVGRWRSGAPLSRSPDGDNPSLARCAMANNDFRFDDDSPDRQNFSHFPRAKADSLGAVCPVSAHIRKLNVRDQASDVGGTSATQARRILRVGIPYGPPLPLEATQDDHQDRGLLFMSIQASIEDQFEFLQARWMNNAIRPRGPGGHDLLMGQTEGSASTRLFSHDLAESRELTRDEPFVTMTGGGYFFVPSLTTLGHLLTSGRPTA